MKRFAVACVIASVVAGVTSATPAATWLRGLSFDLTLAVRATIGAEAAPARSPSAVIAIDEETYRRPPFAGTPKAAWPQYLGAVYEGVLANGALVIGQDVVLPTSLETLAPGVDRPYLAALARHGRGEDRIVLGAVRHQGEVVGPHSSHRLLVGGDPNIRLLNLNTDPDGVIREVPLAFGAGDEEPVTAFAAELARRAGWTARAGAVHVNLRRDPAAAPVYSLADIHACVEAGDGDYLRRAFEGRVVLVGAVLDIEDRKTTSARYLARTDGDHFVERCVHPIMASLFADAAARGSVPGVLIHAQAVNDLLLDDALTTPGPLAAGLAAWLAALIAAVSGVYCRPRAAAAVLGGLCVAAAAAAAAAMSSNIVLPALPVLATALVAGGLAYAYRFVIADRDGRLMRRSFAKYLSPAVVDELVRSGATPEPGGETREVTIWFSDLAGFTRMSEGMTPEELVSALNAYLSVMTEAITSSRGMIDKYIGDAVVGVFGAPLDDPDHAASALEAVRACDAALADFKATRPDWPDTRIGVHTGRAVVGNIGSDLRLDYTVMGDAVNLAARLESLNKRYGETLLVSEATVRAAGATHLRAIDTVQVSGRSSPTTVYGRAAGLSETALATYEAALRALAAGAFEEAAVLFSSIGDEDPVASRMGRFAAARSERRDVHWPGYFILDEK